jgi:hypothetical protein
MRPQKMEYVDDSTVRCRVVTTLKIFGARTYERRGHSHWISRTQWEETTTVQMAKNCPDEPIVT